MLADLLLYRRTPVRARLAGLVMIVFIIAGLMIMSPETGCVYAAAAGEDEGVPVANKGFVTGEYRPGDFPLVFAGKAAALYVEGTDYPGVQRAAKDLRDDVRRVTGQAPAMLDTLADSGEEFVVIIGSLDKSGAIEDLLKRGKLDAEEIRGKWESYVIQVVDKPVPGVGCGLVIAGSDQRGTIYGIYKVSEEIGVSPWYWWADVTPEQKEPLVVKKGLYKQGEPSVKYRGIFLNNESPSLTRWVQTRFGGYNSLFYEKVFELILRLKGNYLWPAMWSPKSFFRDDPDNLEKAKEYGVVIGTSHHEPMMRSWGEWGRFGKGEWNFSTNAEVITKFWTDGIEHAKDIEKIVTLGMRGDGDEPMMADGTIEEKIAIMEEIISVQRRILKEKIGGNLTEIPQVITLYKEVQEFYEKGMRIPEDITIMYANDNFGNIRILPEPEERNRAGGFGMYYHFDYVGAPRSYRWANSVPLPKIWDQMRMTYEYGVDRIWIVNVGCLKPHEVATEFFLDMAYDINKWHKDNLSEFARQWAEREFGPEYAADIAGIYLKYTKFNGRRKPEIIAPNTYSLVNYKEAERVQAEFSEIAYKAEEIYNALPDAKKDAFYQLVLYPARGSMNVLKVNVYAGLNNLYARQGRTMANVYADLVKFIFDEEAAATGYYNQKMANGKWRGMMSDAHIGQTQWQTPERNIMPKIEKVAVEPGSEMGVAVEGSEDAKRGDGVITSLPEFSVFTRERQYIEIFNCKRDPFEAVLTADVPWIKMSANKIPVEDQVKVWLDIDWDKAPKGKKVKGNITVSGAGSEIQVAVVAFNPETPTPEELEEYAFMESDGHIAIEAEHYAENVAVGVLGWQKIPDYGRTLSSMVVLRGNGVHPSTSGSRTPGKDAPYLEYKVYIENPNEDIEVAAYIAPSLNVQRDHGLRYAVALDDEPPQVVDTFPKEYDAHHSFPVWAHGVMDNIRINSTWHRVTEPGYHRLRFWMIDPGIVLQRIVIDAGGGKAAVRHSYLGPPESFYKGKKEAAPVKDGYMELLTAYDYARCLAKTTRTGKNHGETSQEEKDVLTASVVPARAVLREKQASLAERLAMLAEANKALKRFKSSLIFMEGYEDLAAKVAEARAVLSLARIGRRHGEHPPEAKEALDAVIAKAEEFLANEKATVRQRRNAMKQIDKQIKAFQKSIVIDPKNRVIYPSDDTFVRGGGNAKNSFGSQARMEVKLDAGQESMTRYAFIRFDFSQYKDIDRAVLRLYAEFIDTLASRKMSLYDVTGLQLTESKLTWETAPLTGGTLITSFEVKSGALGWYEIDLTEAVQRNIKNGEISLRLQVDISHWAGAVFFTSKEGERNHPELNIFLK